MLKSDPKKNIIEAIYTLSVFVTIAHLFLALKIEISSYDNLFAKSLTSKYATTLKLHIIIHKFH